MTSQEIKVAMKKLYPLAKKIDIKPAKGGSFALAVYWREGGDRVFYTMDYVNSWLANPSVK
ncbi:MAG: hypothetical protein GY841_02895 [FCB group bacterium]|nr:hypothetical protein [FCB group bacterium]